MSAFRRGPKYNAVRTEGVGPAGEPRTYDSKADWAATWRNWCRNAKPPAPLGVAQRPDRIDRQLLTAGLMTGAIRPSEPTTTITTLETFDVAPRVIAA